jgi:fibronectin type 3 domain-containing protein
MSRIRNRSQWRKFISAIAVLLFTLGALRAQAQDAAPKQPHAMAVASPGGIWIFLGSAIPKDEAYQVFYDTGDQKQLAISSAPASREELAQRIRHFASYFRGLAPVDSGGIDRLWEYLQSHDEVTELPAQNIPLSHLALGTAVLDTTATDAKDGTGFRYRIQLGSSSEETNRVTWPAQSTLPAPKRVKSAEVSFDGARVHLRWSIPADAKPAGVLIRRRNKMQGDFAPISVISGFHAQGDSVYAVGRDDQVVRNSVYEYTASLVDHFANPGPPSEPVTVSTFPAGSVPAVASLHAVALGENHQVRLEWKLVGQSYLRSIEIERSAEFDGPFRRIATLSPEAREYVDVIPTANENAYYRIITSGADETAMSAVVAAMATQGEIPLPPQSVRAESSNEGIQILWRGVGPHILGYYVYRASAGADWQQISSLVAPDSALVSYADTSQSLDGRTSYSYAVRSVSDAYALSELSESASARPPANYTISTPLHLRAKVEADRVQLFWDLSLDRDPTVAGYAVFRRDLPDGQFSPVFASKSYAPRQNYGTDSTVTAGASYEYAVQAIDVNGIKSALSTPLSVQVPELGSSLPSPSGVRAMAVAEGIRVSWSRVLDERVVGYRIYRHAAGEKAKVIAESKGAAESWMDSEAKRGTTYLYSMTAVDAAGSESSPSEPVAAYRR